MASDGDVAVELRGVTKAFGPIVANRDVSLRVRRGTIHALVGENGAGKSTCMKVLYGLYRPDSGQILVNGVPRTFRTPRDAARAGLGMVHQHFMLSGPHSGLDNVLLGAEPVARGTAWLPAPLRPIDREAARGRLRQLAEAYRFQVDLDAPVETLAVGTQQRLEILKLLYRDASVMILDEPTAVLTPQEVDEFFANLTRLKHEGKTILVITHKLGEVLRFADEVTVLRRGAVVATRAVAGQTAGELAALMVGRAVQLTASVPPPPRLGPPALELAGVTLPRPRGRAKLSDISLTVHGGEIVGIAGIEGNGQAELLGLLLDPQAAFGKGRATGRLRLLGEDATRLSARAVRSRSIGFVPEDRHAQALLLDADLRRNFLLGRQRTPELARFGLIRARRLAATTAAQIRTFDIRPADPDALACGLSGGNQQKLVLARELHGLPRLCICAQPTRGVDVGSIEFIHQRLLEARAGGAAILLVSSELDEIQALADRIVVIEGGRCVATFARGEADQETLGRCMGGERAF